ncbi:branched-chain amino acid ABC transporter permease [Eoetvoesiella caeni]|uniref:Amino acid/amide ABC transporter membrane protein 2 (HAAT family) n=1 Tax=Eoetvoesiella caeni TaxID=645616 RepID=A0A366HGY0_9BURK|nr:branched-chain amino acid ABC transporter permease [Eoetvoesiella caeni]MCI2807985.1 branched-chain amino acid ABC transporter permease [Eoetvoesiella caeni]NYT54012.1 branched-chain amino acid ABC transporter permease [Eoetvoesiella caeni]RBP41904.1 amino acid/amide ABC transporter membrane protein 2 (HAAT family) [Eoetvoesiella caeni]
MNRKYFIVGVIFLILLLVPFIADVTSNSFITNMATRFVIYALAAVSLDLVLGYGAMISFGHAAFFGIGGYVVAIIGFHMDMGDTILGWAGSNSALIVWPLAMLVAAVIGLAMGFLSLRTSGVQFIMITLAFAQMLYFVLVGLVIYGGDDGLSVSVRNAIPGLDVENSTVFYYVCLALMAVWVWICRRIVNSPFGMALRGFKQNERRNINLGYAPMRYKLTAFVISAAGTGLAGALWANYALYASPDMAAWLKSGEFMAMIVLGGMGSIFGPILGAAVYLGLEQTLTAWTENWMLFLGPILVLVILYAKRGLFGWLAGSRSND